MRIHRSYQFFACIFLTFLCLFGTSCRPSDRDKAYALVEEYYPDPSEPGISILIKKNNEVLVDLQKGTADTEHFQSLQENSLFRMASVSKQFTAMAVYKLIDEGKLSFETPIQEVLTDLPMQYSQVRVKHLLQHSGGIVDYENLIPKDRVEQISDADVLELIRTQDSLYFEPGTQFRYSNTGFCLLALMAEKVSGKAYSEWVQSSIFEPLHLKNATLYDAHQHMDSRAFGFKIDVNGNVLPADQSVTSATKGDGCVYISKGDYSTWLASIMQNDFPSTNYLKDLEAQKLPVRDGVSYSLGWFISSAGQLFHSGETSGFRNFVFYDPAQKIEVIVFSNRNEAKIGHFVNELLQTLAIDYPKNLQDPGLFYWMSEVF